MGRLGVLVVRWPHCNEGCEGGALYFRDRVPWEGNSPCKGPGAGARPSVLKEYEGSSCVCGKVIQTEVLTD